MKRGNWMAGLGVLALLVSCSREPESKNAQVPTESSLENPAQLSPESVSPQATSPQSTGTQPAKPQNFPNPIASPVATVEVPAVPGLLKPTNPARRATTITTGRQNPFEATPTPPLVIPVVARGTQSPGRSQPSLSQRPLAPVSTLPTVPIAANPALLPPLTVPANPTLTPLPPVGVPTAPPSPSRLAETIEITGILQVKGQWNVIVKEPGAPTSRYVKTGDYLANGTVLVKRILPGAEPAVVLQQNGKEVIKSLGSAS